MVIKWAKVLKNNSFNDCFTVFNRFLGAVVLGSKTQKGIITLFIQKHVYGAFPILF